MMTKPTALTQALAALGLCLAAPAVVHAADPVRAAPTGGMAGQTDGAGYSDRSLMKEWNGDKDMLQQSLAGTHERGWYAKTLADKGYQVTSVNVDKPTELEYEVVKGRQTYEVRVDFDKGKDSAKKVDVSSNMWRADATKQAMAGKTVPVATGYVKGNEAYSDRRFMKGWSGDKTKLEKQLGVGHDRAYYLAELKKLGYQVTATNDSDKDSVEYEVVKGRNTYEVQIDFANGMAKKVDVGSNFWHSDGTEQALDAKKS